ncbi:receptor-like protein kinase [Carica papaya]|uniref:receptor-like protein kinase n=1 Tax=Carica papaya TaxID=3649 RepID=UPI000B8CB8C7|nr:receptor-like protein kinase [Carica papaya]
MGSHCFYLVVFLILAGELIAVERKLEEVRDMTMEMEEEELLGVFEVMGSFLEDPEWAQMHPQPCSETPWPGIECEIGQENPPIFHVTKIHIGPDVINPPCKFSANLSDSLPQLRFLKTLSVFNCFLTSPVTLSQTLFASLSSLEHLSLQSNPSLSGHIPSSLTNISGLRVLSLSQNNLQGPIPNDLEKMISLEQLDLSDNNLDGEIPREISGLTSLEILDLSWNNLRGQLPSSLGQLQHLQKIDLRFNKLSRLIPPDLGKLNRLVLLDLSHNYIPGPIPETLSGLQQLQYLLLDHNPINSPIPLFVSNLNNLTSISLSGCGLKGPIPSSLFSSLNNLTALSLANNSLTGSIPTNLALLPNLNQLNLSHNQLSGKLLLPEIFIIKLGNRLDLRGNYGICTSNDLYSKINYTNSHNYPQTLPPCMGKGIGEINTSYPQEGQHQEHSKDTQPSWHHGRTSSSSTGAVCICTNLILSSTAGFVLCFMGFLL